jgi:hypothetical protein
MCLSSVVGSSLYATDLGGLRGGPASPMTDVLTFTFADLGLLSLQLLWFLDVCCVDRVSVFWYNRKNLSIDLFETHTLVLGGINKPIQAVKVRVPWDGHLAHQCTKCQYPEWYANFRRLVLVCLSMHPNHEYFNIHAAHH